MQICKYQEDISTAFFENLTLGRAAAARPSALAARVRACSSNLRQVSFQPASCEGRVRFGDPSGDVSALAASAS
jgi:hypothetical protein